MTLYNVSHHELPTLAAKYDSMFHFYLAKGINQLLRKKSYSPEVILFHDLQFLDEEDEFLKRYYRKEEAPGRIQLLANYFTKCRLLPEEMPCLVSQYARKYMFKRVKRYGKLKKRMEEMNKDWDDQFPQLYEQYLHSVRTSQLNESSSVQAKPNISYDSVTHDVYESHAPELPRMRVQKRILSIQVNQEDQEVLLAEPKHLICDFNQTKKVKVHPKMYLDLKRLGSHEELGIFRKEDTYQKKNISSLSPEEHHPHQQKGFFTSRQQNEATKAKEAMYLKRIAKDLYTQPYNFTDREYLIPANADFKMKKHREYPQRQTIQRNRSSNKEHQEYMRLLEKIGKKYRSPEISKKSPNPPKKSKLKLKQEAPAFHPNRLQTLRYKAMRLIGETKEMREVKSSDPTVRHK